MMRKIVSVEVTPRFIQVRGDRHSLDLAMPHCGVFIGETTVGLPFSPLAVRRFIGDCERQGIKVALHERTERWLSYMDALHERIRLADGAEERDGLYQHQAAFAERSLVEPFQYATDETGSGKSISALAAINLHRALNVLIVCPNIVKWQWWGYVRDWTSLEPLVFDGSGRKEKERFLKEHRRDWGTALIVSWDSLRLYYDLLSEYRLDAIIADECHFAKNKNAIRTQALTGAPGKNGRVRFRGLHAPLKIALSGTPFETSAADLWAIIYWGTDVRKTGAGYTAYWRFADFFTNLTKNPFAETFVPKGVRNDEILVDAFKPWMRRVGLDQIKDMPPIQWQLVPLRMTKEHEKVYKAEARRLTLENPLATLSQLRQLAFDPALLGIQMREESVKVEAVRELLRGLPHVVVFSSLKNVLFRALREAPGLRLTGDTSQSARQTIVEKFKRERTRLYMTTQMGIGLDFPSCSHALFLDLPWSHTQFVQSLGRIRRLQSSSTVVTVPLVMGTIEERIYDVLSDKREISERVLAQLISEHLRSF